MGDAKVDVTLLAIGLHEDREGVFGGKVVGLERLHVEGTRDVRAISEKEGPVPGKTKDSIYGLSDTGLRVDHEVLEVLDTNCGRKADEVSVLGSN